MVLARGREASDATGLLEGDGQGLRHRPLRKAMHKGMYNRNVALTRPLLTRADHFILQDDVTFARFLADNLCLLDYTTNEEIMIVVGELRTILSMAGMQVYSAIDDELEEREAEVRKLAQKKKVSLKQSRG